MKNITGTMKNIIDSKKLIEEMENLDDYFISRKLSFNESLLVMERIKQKILMNRTLEAMMKKTLEAMRKK